MVFSVATRVVRRRSSAIKLSAPMEEFGEIPIMLGFDPFGRRDMHNSSNNTPDAIGSEGNVDIGDYPMAILTRGATAEDPVIQVAPHVHVIHAAEKEKGPWAGLGLGIEATRVSTSVSFSKWALSVPPSLSLAISQSNTTATSPCPSPHDSDGETTPKATDFAEAARLKLDASCSSSATMALARRAHVRLPSASLNRRNGIKNHSESKGEVEDDENDHRQHEDGNHSVASSSFLPLRPTTRPLRTRHKRFSSAPFSSKSEGPEKSESDLDHALPLQPTSINNMPGSNSPSSCRDSVILPVASLLMNHSISSYYDDRYSSHNRWSSSSFNTVTTPIDWSMLESTLGCSTPTAETSQSQSSDRSGHSPRPKTSPTRTPEQKSFADRPLPPVPSITTLPIPEIVVHEPGLTSPTTKRKRRGVMVGGPGVGRRTSRSELLPGCSGIEFD
ncbi:hypothetical protein FRB97_004664 [Tulasnella sp. 331]|nr:hypothetical protein FRB97_004664 [Tulasnella sp. 331]